MWSPPPRGRKAAADTTNRFRNPVICVNFRAMIRRLLLLLTMLAAAPAQATSVGRAPLHEPVLACVALDELVTAIGKGALPQGGLAGDVQLYDDRAGRVLSAEEKAAFIAALREENGKPDRTPVQLGRVSQLASDGTSAAYLVELERDAWQLVSYEQDAMLMAQEVPDPHWERTVSYWLATFRSSRLQAFRAAPELWPLVRTGAPGPGCLRIAPTPAAP